MNQANESNKDTGAGIGQTPCLAWDIGTAYDFFISLQVLNQPDHYGLRASWAAGVRSRLPAGERKFLDEVADFYHLPAHWVYTLPQPKDATMALWALRQMPVEQRLPTFLVEPKLTDEITEIYQDVLERRRWGAADMEKIKAATKDWELPNRTRVLSKVLDWLTRPEEFGEQIYAVMQAYYQSFFAEEEKRIAPALKLALQRAKDLAKELPFDRLLEELSQGLHFGEPFETPEVVLAPSYWVTPLVFFGFTPEKNHLLVFGARPQNASLVPGEQVPDALLRGLKALADPTRLKILRYLAEEPLMPAELARRLRLRAPTVIHHLKELRLAGLVHITLMPDEQKRYASRQEAVETLYKNFMDFMESGSGRDEED
jgi:DNA-binding transcriptional ArsR family regulator